MKLDTLKERIKKNPKHKKIILDLMMHPIKKRPRKWVRFFLQPFYMKKGKKSVIYRSVRKDITPFNQFILGNNSIIEDFAAINNAVGDLTIGNNSGIGLGCVLIGPISMGNSVKVAQNCVISGLNHNYMDINKTIASQGITTNKITINDDVWIGANTVILAGITIGKRVIIGAGSVVVDNIPSYSIAVGNPCKVVKKYDPDKNEWVRV